MTSDVSWHVHKYMRKASTLHAKAENEFSDCMLLRMLLLAWHHTKMNQIERFGIRNTSSRPLQSPGNIVIHSAVMRRDKIWTERKKWEVAVGADEREDILHPSRSIQPQAWILPTCNFGLSYIHGESLLQVYSREWRKKLSHILP